MKNILRHLPGPIICACLTSYFDPSQYRFSDRLPIWILIFILCLACLIALRVGVAFVRSLIEE